MFRAIYSEDPNLNVIVKEAFDCMKQQNIKGNICPYIKKAIHECLKLKKEELNKIWINELTEIINSKTRLKSVSDNVEAYGRILIGLIDAYTLYEESVEKIVEVWQEMLNGSNDLKETFYLLIMTEFSETIWWDKNIKILMEEIIQHKDELNEYNAELEQLIKIDNNLEKATQKWQNKHENKAEPANYATCNEVTDHDEQTCNQCNKVKFPKKKKSKSKEVNKQP